MSTNIMQIKLRPHQERGVAAMQKHNKGQIIVPTGGGKTLKMIYDCLRQLQSETPQTIVVVAPRILLAEQLSAEFLEFITNAKVFHVHSGETHLPTTLCLVLLLQRLMWIPSTLMRHIILFSDTFSLQLSTSLLTHDAHTSSLPPRNIPSLLANLE
jgi:N12 class adenine-specific DNA methylase